MSADDVVELGEPFDLVAGPELADPRTLWDAPIDLMQRPVSVPGRVLAGLLPWDERDMQRVFDLRVEPYSARGARHVVWWSCSFWGLGDVGECAAACVSELVANAIAHAQWPTTQRQRVHLVVSLSAATLLVEVCDPDPRWPGPKAAVDWDAVDWSAPGDTGESGFGLGIVRARVAELGGEFGCVSGAGGKSVFFALPVSQGTVMVVADRREEESR